jgi:hypothetical protein
MINANMLRLPNFIERNEKEHRQIVLRYNRSKHSFLMNGNAKYADNLFMHTVLLWKCHVNIKYNIIVLLMFCLKTVNLQAIPCNSIKVNYKEILWINWRWWNVPMNVYIRWRLLNSHKYNIDIKCNIDC